MPFIALNPTALNGEMRMVVYGIWSTLIAVKIMIN